MDQPGLDLCTRDKSGSSPFATAMTMKNNKAAQKILQLEPQAAEQFDSRGRNFLHTGKYTYSLLMNNIYQIPHTIFSTKSFEMWYVELCENYRFLSHID